MQIIKFEMKIMKIKTNLRISIDSYENHKWWYDKQKLGESRNKLNFVITEEQYKKFYLSTWTL